MRTFVTILGIAGGIVLLLLLGVAIAVWAIDPNEFVGPLQARIKAATGRDVTIGGGIELKLGLEPKLVAKDVRMGNAPWARTPDMVTAKSVEVEVALLPLLRRRFELLRFNLIEPRIALETNAQGRGNWELTATPGAAGAPGADSGATTLSIGNLAITRGELTYRDGATGSETHVVIDELALSARDAQSPVNAEFRGKIDGIAVALTGNLGPLATLADRRLPYPVAVQGDVGGKKASAAAKVRRADGLVELQDIDVTSGASNVKGRVEIREAGPRATWTVDLASPSLAVDDLPLPRAAAPATKKAPVGTSGTARFLFSDMALPFEALRKNNAKGEVTIGRLTLTGGRPLDRIHVQFTLRDGKLDVPAFQASALGGTVSGSLSIDASHGQAPAIALSVDGHALDLAAVLAMAGVAREVRGGKTEVAIDVTMRGDSPRKWASGVGGRVRATVGPATLVNAKLDPALAFDRLAQAVNPFRAVDPSTELRCAVIRLPLAGGVAQIDRAIAVETKQADISASGTLDFRNETLDLSIRPRIRQGIRVEIPQIAEIVRFRGTFTTPTVAVDAVASAAAIARIGAAVGTGGLSMLGESMIASGGPGACDVALGKASPVTPTDPGAGAAKRRLPPTGDEDLGKAIGRLFQR
jgi:hypothetical protein